MKIDKEQEEIIINCGAFGYDATKIANVLKLDQKEFEKELNKQNSTVSIAYEKGKDRADYVIDLKLFEMAKAGDIAALDKLDQRKKIRENKNKQNKRKS